MFMCNIIIVIMHKLNVFVALFYCVLIELFIYFIFTSFIKMLLKKTTEKLKFYSIVTLTLIIGKYYYCTFFSGTKNSYCHCIWRRN